MHTIHVYKRCNVSLLTGLYSLLQSQSRGKLQRAVLSETLLSCSQMSMSHTF